jgi:hypothetical protein
MKHPLFVRWSLFAAVAATLFVTSTAVPQAPRPNPPKARPKLEAVAETKLLMEGLMQPNYRGLERALKARPADETAWVYARGQALLIAETGNLLMLRPPKTSGQDAWLELASDLREKATKLARSVASKDLDRSRTGLVELATTCNRCHTTFGQQVRVVPFSDPNP